jgi:hypothetical protein
LISPLISLQHDQIENIEEEQPGEAAAIDALGLEDPPREERLEELADEELEFLFLAAGAARAGRRQVERLAGVERIAAGRGRGALHLRVGPRLTAGLSCASAPSRSGSGRPPSSR